MNNNQWDELVKLIVPVILVIFWAINQLFQKDLTAPRKVAPGRRAGEGPPPPGRIGGETRPRMQPFEPEMTPERRRVPPGEDMVILSSETRSTRHPKAGRPNAGGGAAARPKSGKKSRNAADTRSGTRRADSISGADLSSGSERLERTSILGPLTSVSGGPAFSESSGVSDDTPEVRVAGPTTPIGIDELREAMLNPRRLREAILVSEILQPPLVLRSRRSPGT